MPSLNSALDQEPIPIDPPKRNLSLNEALVTKSEEGNRSIYLGDINRVGEYPAHLSDDAISYDVNRNVYGEPERGFFGYINVGTDIVKNFGKGAASFFVEGAPKSLVGLASMSAQEPLRLDVTDVFGALTGNPIEVQEIFTLLDPDTRLQRSRRADQIRDSLNRLSTSIGTWANKLGIEPDEGTSNKVAFDIGSGTSSLLTALGLTYVAKGGAASAAVLFGGLQTGSTFTEAEEAGKDFEEARAIATLTGLGEGGLEFVGLEVWTKWLRGSKTVRRMLLRGADEFIQESAQTLSQETIAKLSKIKNTSWPEIFQQAGYSGLIGLALGLPIGGVHTAIENRGVIGKLRAEGFNDVEIEQVVSDIQNTVIEKSLPEIQSEITHEATKFDAEVSEQVVYEENQSATESTTSTTEVSEESKPEFPPLVQELMEITQAINERTEVGEPVEESLLKRQQAIMQTFDAMQGVGKEGTPINERVLKVLTGQLRAEPKKYTEMQALKGSLKAQSRAAFAAKQATKKDLADLKLGLVAEIKSRVPAKEQRRFLSILAKADSGTAIVKAVDRIDRIVEEDQRRQIIDNIESNLKRIVDSQSIAVDIQERIADLGKGIDFVKRRASTIKSLQRTQEFLNKKRAEGEDVSLPQAVLDKLSILSRQPAENISTPELINILADIQALEALGRLKLKVRQHLDAMRKQRELSELTLGTKPLSRKELVLPKLGEELQQNEKVDNFKRKVLNGMMEKELAITPMDVIFDMLDGNAGYVGPNFRIFKKTIDQSFSDYVLKKEQINQEILELADALDLTEAQFERIGFYAAKMQDGGFDKLEGMGFSKKEIDVVSLDDKEQAFYNAMRRKLDALRPEVEELMRTVYNEDLGQYKNYFPFMTDFDSMSDSEIRDYFGNNIKEFSPKPSKEVERGFTKERVGGKNRIKLHAMEVFLRHSDNAAYLLTVGQHTKRLGDLAATSEYKKSAGDLGQQIVRDWIDTVSRKGRLAGQRQTMLDTLRINVGQAQLGFKLSSVFIQPSALMEGAGMIGTKAFDGAQKITTSKDWRKFVFDNMPEIKARIGDDPAFLEFYGAKGLKNEIATKAFWALQKLDALTASSVAAGAYIKFVEDHGGKVNLEKPDLAAIEYAQLIVRRSQASAFFKDAPQAITRGALTGDKSIDRLILQFQTFMLNKYSMIRHDLLRLGIKPKNRSHGLNMAMFLILSSFAEYGLRRLSNELIHAILGVFGDPEDLPEIKDEITKQTVMNLLQNIPFISQVIGSLGYGSIPVPALDMIRRSFDQIETFKNSKKPLTKIKNGLRAAVLISGLFGVAGSAQADQIIKKGIKTVAGSSLRAVPF